MSKKSRLIFLACPWHPLGGGMFKVTDYLVQHQAHGAGDAELRPLDTRGGGSVLLSLYFLPKAMLTLLWHQINGRLAGVHVNMAERASAVRKGLLVVFARLIGARVLIHLHAAQLHLVYRALPGPLQALLRWVFSLAHEVLVLGTASRAFVLDELQCRPERVRIVINGVPAPKCIRRGEEVAGRPFRILFVGNLSERKGVSDLLTAFTQLGKPNTTWHVTLAGGGDVEGYRRRARDLGLGGNVEFIGWAHQTQVADLMANADVLVLPSYDEGLPLVILEALAMGLAVICTPVGEIPGIFVDGRDVLFVPPGDSKAITAALQRLIAEPDLRRSLEVRGCAYHRQAFSIEAFFLAVAQAHQRVFGASARFDPRGAARAYEA